MIHSARLRTLGLKFLRLGGSRSLTFLGNFNKNTSEASKKQHDGKRHCSVSLPPSFFIGFLICAVPSAGANTSEPCTGSHAVSPRGHRTQTPPGALGQGLTHSVTPLGGASWVTQVSLPPWLCPPMLRAPQGVMSLSL